MKTLTGQTIILQAELSSRIYDLKIAIENTDGIHRTRQRLIFAGRQLEDNRMLSDYNIQEGSTLHLIMRLAGT